MKGSIQAVMWIMWTAALAAYVYLFVSFPFSHADPYGLFDYIIFGLLAILVSFFPIFYREYSIVIFQWVSLASFLLFGIFVEIIITQIAVLTTVIITGINRHSLYRIPMNSIMFLLSSIASAAVYYSILTLFSVLPETMLTIIGAFAYGITFIIVNHLGIFFIRNVLRKIPSKFFTKGFNTELTLGSLVLPIGVIVVMLYSEIGRIAAVYMGFSFIGMSLIFKLYHESRRLNKKLKEVSLFGYELGACLNRKELVGLFLQKLKQIFTLDAIHIYRITNGEMKLVEVYNQEGTTLNEELIKQVSLATFEEKKAQIRKNKKSILSVPVYQKNDFTAIVTIALNEERAFQKWHQMILEIMTNYLAVAMDNATYYEKKKDESERCHLTGLYNIRYFERALEKEVVASISKNEKSSVILLDLDHFKKVNDTYGHQAGNDVLCNLANILIQATDDKGIVARYGGEEFVVLLPNTAEIEANLKAESIRQTIEEHPFVVKNDLENGESVTIQITASIGVATSIADESSPMALLRNADRAMYTGAKQKGRNKVAAYAPVRAEIT
ncbi:GGDEF domain-containing protein [Bacillus sp. FJAT-45350]|uniref:GGDEF domain-containing protein n=1 Tax=Bacillus sp. FJAT-45350 TaxID=2011014 RepID=UPI0015C8F9FB|nr:GGDEF domain-containing protein [Bacillus sp. FJAT-45350]